MPTCPRCSTAFSDAAASCPLCGENAPSAPQEHAAAFDPATVREANEPYWNEPPSEPPDLVEPPRPLRLRSTFTATMTTAGFFVGFAAAGLFGLMQAGRPPGFVNGCLMIVLGGPFLGILFALGFGAVAVVMEAVVRGTANALDPRARQALRALADDEEDERDDRYRSEEREQAKPCSPDEGIRP